MTGMPARRLGLAGRGFVREGYAADLLLFDPETDHLTLSHVRGSHQSGDWYRGSLGKRYALLHGPGRDGKTQWSIPHARTNGVGSVSPHLN